MAQDDATVRSLNHGLNQVLAAHEAPLLQQWLTLLRAEGGSGGGRIKEGELQTQCREFLAALRDGLTSGGGTDANAVEFQPARDLLSAISSSRAMQGFSPSETATFVFSLKQPLFEKIVSETADPEAARIALIWQATKLLDRFGLFTTEVHQQAREAIVERQREEISELSTPVVKLWDGILALPLIGTLDSARTQVVMETLLQAIVDEGAEIAIIDITGVPTVDTLVAQHLLKTVAATRLMGADCVVSGIRPQIAQTMVHLGVELDVVSKASLADAFALALNRTGRRVVRSEGIRATERA